MWKCVHRGLRSSTGWLKADQSNGGCIVSTIVNKDIDELPPHSATKNKCHSCSEDNFGSVDFKKKIKTHPEQTFSVQESNENGSSQSRKNFSIPSHTQPVIPADSTSGLRKINDSYVSSFHSCDKNSRSSTLLSCRKCHRIYEGDLKCACYSKPRQLLWLSKKLKIHDSTSSTPVATSALLKNLSFKSLQSENGSPKYASQEENKSVDHPPKASLEFDSLKTSDAEPTTRLSYLNPKNIIEEKRSTLSLNHAASSSFESQFHQKSLNCLLKLPFLSYNLNIHEGINRFSPCWLNKSKTEFGRGDNRSRESNGQGESEEAENTWKHYQIHQSLLEAISWSSAVLLGWFLAQCRIHGFQREGCSRKLKREGERKSCIAGTFAKIFFCGITESHQFLKVLPSKLNESICRPEQKEENGTFKQEDRTLVKSRGSESEGYFTDTLIGEDDLKEHLPQNVIFHQNSEPHVVVPRDTKSHVKEQVPLIREIKTKSAIPMPWHAKQELPFGPITFEEAAKEAGKVLEEVQAEILLQLALEKLDEGENANHVQPSAVELLKSSAELGSITAAFNLGICYEIGVGGVTKDLSQAYYWYKKASDSGHATATYNIAVFHGQGLAGLRPNTQLAQKLLERASMLGQPEATAALASTFKPDHDVVSKHSLLQETPSLIYRLSDDNEQKAVSSSVISYVNNGSDAHKHAANSSLSTKPFMGWLNHDNLKLGHLMDKFYVPFSKQTETEDSLAEMLLDNSTKEGNFGRVSAIPHAH